MENKLQLHEIVGYLPYGLECEMILGPHFTKEISILNTSNIWHIDNDVSCVVKPILHPLSDLTKEIEVNGERFVPINVLNETFLMELSFKRKWLNQVEMDEITDQNILAEPFEVIQKLYEWHFDINDLINRGLAIDINTLNK